MAWLEKRGNKYWIVYREGTRRQKFNTGISDLPAARVRLREFDAARTLNLVRSKYVKAPDRLMDFSGALELYLSQKTFSDSTIELYQLAAAAWIAANGNHPLHRYSLESFSSFYASLKKKNLSQNTISIYSRSLFALFKWLVNNKYATSNPITRVPELHRDVSIIPDDDLALIIEHAPSKLKFIIEFLLATGLRTGEAVDLRWGDIDTAANLIKIHNQKKRRYDTIPILTTTAAILAKHTPGDPRARVFGYNTYNSVRLAWDYLHKRLIEKLKLMENYYNLHQLRKTCGTKLAEAGVYEYELQFYMRHKSIQTTYKYYVQKNVNQIKSRIDSLLPPTIAPKKPKKKPKSQ